MIDSITQQAAAKIAKTSGISEAAFKASKGLLENFKQRHQLVKEVLQGEWSDAPVERANDFKARLPLLLAAFNADEVGLFCEQAGRRTFLEQGQDPVGRESQKDDDDYFGCCHALSPRIHDHDRH